MGLSPKDAVIDVGYASDRGQVRENNEDALIVAPPLFMVADGMGGHLAGEVASRIAVESMAQDLSAEETAQLGLQELVDRADVAIRDETLGLAGTTVTGVVLRNPDDQLVWQVFNVGDSRTYLYRGEELTQVTEDHSQVQEMVKRGQITPAEALVHPRRNVVTRAVGTGGDHEVEAWDIPAEDGDRILVCSDGLTNEVADKVIAKLLKENSGAQDATDALIEAAMKSGARDNISVIVIGVDASGGDGEGADGEGAAADSATQDSEA